MVTQHSELAEIFADHFAKISRDPNMKGNPKKCIRRKKEDNQPYRERTESSHKTTEKDTIHLQMIKKLPPETLKYLLDLYNKIWKEVMYQMDVNLQK